MTPPARRSSARYRQQPRSARDVRARRFQDCLCGFGIRQNGAERLVNFMSNTGSQFASHREAVDMGKFRHALPGLHFGKLTPRRCLGSQR
jgi:hypothetical protein